jgi:hypothetical protein
LVPQAGTIRFWQGEIVKLPPFVDQIALNRVQTKAPGGHGVASVCAKPLVRGRAPARHPCTAIRNAESWPAGQSASGIWEQPQNQKQRSTNEESKVSISDLLKQICRTLKEEHSAYHEGRRCQIWRLSSCANIVRAQAEPGIIPGATSSQAQMSPPARRAFPAGRSTRCE